MMGGFLERVAATPTGAKVAALIGVIALLCGGYWYFFYSDLMEERQQLQHESEKLNKEKKDYEKRKQEYLAYRNEVSALEEEQKELLRVLPKRDDIEQFIESVQAQIEISGLSKVSSVREAAQPVEMYLKIPIRMSLLGTYHQINRFFKNVGDLKRIVNIEDLQLAPSTELGAAAGQLKANFVATTFQFVDKAKAGPAKGGTNVTAGGNK
jgi:type IV pilus assembly protein PilO